MGDPEWPSTKNPAVQQIVALQPLHLYSKGNLAAEHALNTH